MFMRMSSAARALVVGVFVVISVPLLTHAFPFGGQITVYHVCYNATLFARLSPPVPGDYVYVSGYTKAYEFGPPRAVGQWLLGLTGIPYDCLWSVSPIYVQPAIAIAMMGSSGPAAPAAPGGAWGPGPGLPVPGGGGVTPPSQTVPIPPLVSSNPTGPGFATSTGGGALVINEIYYDVAGARGNELEHEWIELYNGTSNTINLSGWIIQDAAASDVIPSGTTIASGQYLVIGGATTTRNYWSLPASSKFISLDGRIGDGLSNTGDFVRLRNTANAIVDAASWGSDTTSFNPSIPLVPEGYSLMRTSLVSDTNTFSDWTGRPVPTPGQQ